jgi:hypothetical protein
MSAKHAAVTQPTISHSENCDIHISDASIALRFVNREIVQGTSAKLCHLSRGLIPKGFVVSRIHVFQKQLVTPNWILPLCSPPRHQSTNNQDERPLTPIPPFSTVQSSFLHQTSIVSTLSEGRKSNPTRGSGIGPHSRAMSSDLSRESRPILAGIPRTDIIQKLLVKFDGVLLGLLT